MAKQDYFPDKIDAQDTWFETWLNNILAVLTALGLAVTHANAVKTKITDCRTKFTDWKNAKAQALARPGLTVDSVACTYKWQAPGWCTSFDSTCSST